jgi:hypothetical protein
MQIKLLHPVKVADADQRPLLVFLPGEGQASTTCMLSQSSGQQSQTSQDECKQPVLEA